MFEFWVKSDLNRMPTMRAIGEKLFLRDVGGRKVGVTVTKGGAPYTLTGSVRAWIITDSGTTIQVDGEKEGNKAWVVLPAEACAEVGDISVVIKNLDGTAVTTLGGVYTRVYPAMTDETV